MVAITSFGRRSRGRVWLVGWSLVFLLVASLVGGLVGSGAGAVGPGMARAQAQTALFSDVGGHWAEKYIVQVALKGAVRGYGDGRFRPDEPVSRLECVAMLVRVLGREGEARAANAIPSSFRHPELVPAWGQGYVAVAVDRGIIAGADLLDFRGGDSATRLEVAVWAVRALGLGGEAEGLVNPWLSYTDVHQIPSWARGYVAVAEREEIMKGLPGGGFHPTGQVTRAEMATILARLDDRLTNSLDTSEIRGTLSILSVAVPPSITLKLADQGTRILPVAPGCFVYRDGDRASLSQLVIGEPVRAILDAGGRAVFVDNAPPAESTVAGILVSLVTGANPVVTIEDTEGQRKAYAVSVSCRVVRGGEETTLSRLSSGDEVELTLRGNLAVEIKAQAQDYDLEGVFVRVDYTNPPIIVVRKDGEEKTCALAVDVSVERNGKSSSLSALRPGDEVALVVRRGKVTQITAEATEEFLEGTVQTITIGLIPQITIRTSAGEDKTYPVSSQAVIRKDRTRIQLPEIKPGSYVEVEVESGEVVRMDVEPYTILEDVKGMVEYVVESASVIVISPLGADGASSSTREIHVTSHTLFARGDDLIDFDDVEPGDRVIAVGSRATGIFVARAVVVLTVSE